jgi:predicted anti-sigma-YlaC factor YlaD
MAEAHLSDAELTRWRDHGEGDRARIVAHLALCTSCRHAAAELERHRPVDGGPSQFRPEEFVAHGYAAGSPARTRLTARLVYFAAAAAVLLGIVLVPSWWRERSDSALRGGETPVTLIGPVDTTVSAQELGFEWRAESGVDRLRLRVVAIDDPAKPLIERDVSGTRYEPAADERSRLQPGSELHWFIEYREGGTATGISPAARFRVR